MFCGVRAMGVCPEGKSGCGVHRRVGFILHGCLVFGRRFLCSLRIIARTADHRGWKCFLSEEENISDVKKGRHARHTLLDSKESFCSGVERGGAWLSSVRNTSENLGVLVGPCSRESRLGDA